MLFLQNKAQIDQNNSVPKLNSILQKMKIGPKTNVPFLHKRLHLLFIVAFNFFLAYITMHFIIWLSNG